MKRSRSNLKLGTAAAATLLYALPASGQQAPTRDGAIEQAIQNTIAANLQRRGYVASDPIMAQTKTAVSNAIDTATSSGSSLTGVVTPNRTWAETFRGLLNDLASGFTWPLNLGKTSTPPANFAGGGTFGGGGADGSWDPDCSDVQINFDPQGNLIIPSYSLEVGLPLTFGSVGVNNMFTQGFHKAKTAQAVGRWVTHNLNATRIPQKHWGVIGMATSTTVSLATVAYRDSNNVLVPRETTSIGIQAANLYNRTPHSGFSEIQCPQSGSTGGDFHFYGGAPSWTGSHVHECIAYAPNPTIGEGGYFINKFTSLPMNGTSFPESIAAGYKACLLDANFLKRLSDAIFKKTVGGAPYAPILDEDVRDNNLPTVQDLKDEPTTGTRPDPNPTDVGTPPPPPTTVTPPPSPPPSGVDLGPDPAIGTPSDPEAPTNILDPIFDWLPDLPSIQLNVAGAQCPTWEMQPFQGPEWHLVMDKHCPFISDNAALISTIMILGFTVGSAMIILRA